MTKKSTDLESQAPQTSHKWRGNVMNNSDIGYDPEWDDVEILTKEKKD